MKQEDIALQNAMLQLNGRAWGIAIGLLFGLGLFVATNVLVIRGGPQVGPHLSLLSIYLPGYSVTFLGSVIGFVYLFVIGYAVGRLIGAAYNKMIGAPS